jgi:hypothetical protein
MLAETLSRYSAASPYLSAEVGRPTGSGWVAVDGLLAPDGPARQGWIHALWLAGAAAAVAGGPLIAGFLLERRVPRLRADEIRFRLGAEGWPDRIAFASPRMLVLGSDPAAGAPGAVAAADVAALRRGLAAEIVGFCAALVGAVRQAAKVGERTVWGYLADILAAVYLEAGRVAGDQRAAAAEADLLFDLASPPLRVRPGWLPLEQAGRAHLFRLHGQCCFAYKLEDAGYCATCPFTGEPERSERLRAWLAEHTPA